MDLLAQFLSEGSFVAHGAILSALSVAAMSVALAPERTR
jgi:hypothetical protein